MSENKKLVQEGYKKLLKIGEDYSSKDYIYFILAEITRQLSEKHKIAKFIDIYDYKVIINDKVDKFSKRDVAMYVKALLDVLGVKLINLEFRNNLEENLADELSKVEKTAEE
ncbi:hypothetical protein GOV05_03170 [Candidatus Woesearchaeota archaeon]|nr:hypothetical protein [Candidatus Woesearchaeota archaeon]